MLMGPSQHQNSETRGIFIHLWRSWRSVIAVVSLSVGVPALLLGPEDGPEPGFDVEVTSVVDDDGTTCDGIAKFGIIPAG